MVAKAKCFAISFALSALIFLGLVVAFNDPLIDAIYKNVDDLNDGEMPTTVTSFPSGPDVVGILGGSGEGLNCSLPRGTDIFFDGSPDLTGNRRLVRQQFRQACVAHDLCYRHGLATYGYTQNDCDRILQNQAFRLCKYMRTEKGLNESKSAISERCQQDSKKILAGVSIGGFGSYRAWDRSTFFEYDSDPVRSNFFSVSRVVDHPFKAGDPVRYKDEPPQIILSFFNKRFSPTVRCTNCKTLPEGARLSTNPIWLPPRRDHAAPQLLVDATGKQHLLWLSRVHPENTSSCIVRADATQLLSDTLPKRDRCNATAGSVFNLVEAEMYSSSPLPQSLPDVPSPNDILATGLTPQRHLDHTLSFCLWSENLRATGTDTGNDVSVCTSLDGPATAAGKGMGAFQNFVVVRPGQQLFFARDIALPPASNRVVGFFEHVDGNIYSPQGSLIVLDVVPAPGGRPSGAVKVNRVVPFAIDDRYDPMMPLTRKKDDLRFLSLVTAATGVGVHVTDFASSNPAPRKIDTIASSRPTDLHASWAQRPALVVEAREPEATRLILSRAQLTSAPDGLADAVHLEALILDRPASASDDTPFSATDGVACAVRYTFRPNQDRICLRAFESDRPMRASPAALMKASQLVAGRFGGSGYGLAFVDACLDEHPLVLISAADGRLTFPPTEAPPTQRGLKREVTCKSLELGNNIALPMPAPASR
jgi:hypothetical protein